MSTDAPQAGTLASGAWRLDPERSTVQFSVPNFWGLAAVKGRFESFSGTLDLTADPALELTVDANSLQTGNQRRDKHLRSADFFDVERHPQVRFVSESATLDGPTLRVRGRLQAGAGEVPVQLDAAVRDAQGAIELQAATTVDHTQLGMKWNRMGMIKPPSTLTVNGILTPVQAASPPA